MITKLSPQQSFELVLQTLRNSHLNFCIQETPFSVFLTIRKSYTKNQMFGPQVATLETSEKIKELETEIETLWNETNNLKARNSFLENSNIVIERNFEEEVLNGEHLKSELETVKTKYNTSETILEKTDLSLKNSQNERNLLGTKHEKICAEVKILKSEIKDLEKDKNNLSIALKTAKKENKENKNEHEKIRKKQEATITELFEFKC